jgi:hypothetical protein
VNRFAALEQPFRHRWITGQLQEAARDHPVVVLTGARQVGKSTLLRHAEPFRSWRYRSMDDMDVLAQARTDPAALWAGTEAAVLDERIVAVPWTALAAGA